ncbi:MAG: phage portal protein [Anaeromicrobium sp.]|uniref:phage portal protein n=1 Tax=Anaeromicrobium sp. TaxID=1929132 RepID=UPI0025E1652B|nr:phage portal protein [Anaeromicrobium sp.]MCT4593169.1 phage portal protein [Anaeromicrobium sp.]
MASIKEQLLKLSKAEKKERKQARKDYFYFLGKCKDEEVAKSNLDLLGQSWIVTDDLDYVPTQDIRNKIKPLLKKQARFMFGRAPTILFKPYDPKDKEKCEELRQFIDDILESNGFWSDTLKAFLMCTVKKRVMLRLEANPEQSINLIYHNIEGFNYKKEGKHLKSITLVVQDKDTIDKEKNEKIYYRYMYYMEGETCKLKIETYKGGFNVDKPFKTEIKDTKLSRIPAWVIINGGLLGDEFGESDLDDLKDAQNQYNRRVSDFADALRFQMFGQTVIIDAEEDSVNRLNIAPNAIAPLRSIDERKADMKKVESTFSSAEPVEMYLKRAEHDMYQALDMPEDEQLKEIPSAKAMKYMYNDLIARCEEKWNDWATPIKELIRLIIECCSKFGCYSDWNEEWGKLKFKIVINYNYPIPEDTEDKKRLALEEVNSNVRSHRSYIKDYSDEEDAEGAMKEIAEDIKTIIEAEQDQFQKAIDSELNNLNKNTGDGS